MKNIIAITIILFVFTLLEINAQPDDMRDRILNYQSTSQLEIINRSRRMIIDKFQEGDIKTVEEITNYLLNDKSFEGYIPLHFSERFLILLWTREYTELFRQIRIVDSINNIQLQDPKNLDEKIFGMWARYIYPAKDFLYDTLKSKSRNSANYLRNEFNKAPLTRQEKDLLEMVLIRFSNEHSAELQDSLSTLAEAYIQNYPGDITLPYVRQVFRVRFIDRKIGSFSFLFGTATPTAPMSENFSDMFGFSMDGKFYANRSIIFANILVGLAKNRNRIEENNYYLPAGSSSSLVRLGAGYGYDLFDGEKFSLYPKIDFGYTWFGPDSSKQKSLEMFDRSSFSYSPGFILEYRFSANAPTFNYFHGYSTNEFWGFKISLNYNYLIQSNRDRFLSNVHYFGIGFGMHFKKRYRDL